MAKRRKEVKREKVYWNTYHCQNRIIEIENPHYRDYCKNRFCTICAGIRKADIINKYYPVISKWSDLHFMKRLNKERTRDKKNETKSGYEPIIQGMNKTWTKIVH